MITTHSYALESHIWYPPLPLVDNIDISPDRISEDNNNSEYEEHKFSKDNNISQDVFDYPSPPAISQVEISQDVSDDEDYTPCPYVLTPVEAALKEDNKDSFATLIKSLSDSELSHAYFDMLRCDSINCFAAMLTGELAPFLDTNYFVAKEDNLPLHTAAFLLSCPQITAFLIHQGYPPNLRSDFLTLHVSLKNALPLNVALETYCVEVWLGGSAIHFFTSFWEAPRICNTIAILARNTLEIKHEFFKYLKQGKMVEVGILLAVARDCILSPSTAEGNDDISFMDISEMHKFLSSEIETLSVDATTTRSQYKTQLLEMKNTLQLLEIFDKIGDKFIALSQTSQNGTSEVESLISDAGFDVDALKTNSEFRRRVRLHVVDKGLLPSSFDEEEFCDHVAKYGEITPEFRIQGLSYFSWRPSRVTIIIGKTRVPGMVDFDEV